MKMTLKEHLEVFVIGAVVLIGGFFGILTAIVLGLYYMKWLLSVLP